MTVKQQVQRSIAGLLMGASLSLSLVACGNSSKFFEDGGIYDKIQSGKK